MLSFEIPQKLNGQQLLNELEAAGVIADIPMIADGKLWLKVAESDKAKVKTIVDQHVGKDHVPTIEDKLKAAGIDLNELKTLLGL